MTTEPPPGKRSDQSRTPASQELLLDLNFVPAWARAPAGRNPYSDQEGYEERVERGRRPGGRDRRHGGDDRQSRARSRDRDRRPPRQGERDVGARGGRSHAPRDREGPAAGGRVQDRRPRGDRRDRGDRAGPSEPRLPIDVRFLPDRHKLGAVVREMHHTGKAYPVMELASLFIRKPDHYLVKIQVQKRKGDDAPLYLYQFVLSRHVFTDREQAIQHAVNRHLDDFYDVEETDGEVPTGNYVCVGRCTITGTLLGPPNYHGFQTKLQEMVATRFPQMSFEEYRQRVETVHDPELVSQWKEQMRVQKRYRVKRDGPRAAPKERAGEKADVGTDEAAGDVPELVLDRHEAVQPEAAQAVAVPPVAGADASLSTPEPPPAEDVAPAEETSVPAEPGEGGDATAEEAPEAEASTKAAEDDREAMTWAEARQHLRDHYLDHQIREITRAVIPATIAQELEDQNLKRVIREAWQRESRFPLSLSLAMRPAFRHMRLHLFKVDRKHVFVTPIPPRPLDPGAAVDSIRAELNFLQQHPGCTRRALVEALRPGAALDSPEVAEVMNNFRWLVDKGHVIEFYDGTLALPSAPQAAGHGVAPAPRGRRDVAESRQHPVQSPTPKDPPPAGAVKPASVDAEKPMETDPSPASLGPAEADDAAASGPPRKDSPPVHQEASQSLATESSEPTVAENEPPAPLPGAASGRGFGPPEGTLQRPQGNPGEKKAVEPEHGKPAEEPPPPDPAKELAAAMMKGPLGAPIQVTGDSTMFSDAPSEEQAREEATSDSEDIGKPANERNRAEEESTVAGSNPPA